MSSTMSPTSFAIHVRGLTKTIRAGFWGRRVTLLSDVTFDVARGAVFGFVGPNGAGKSTTIKTLVGVARPSGGCVELYGGSPRDRDVRRRLGYLPEVPNLPPTLTPLEVLRLHARLAGLSPEAATRGIDALLERVELTEKAKARIQTLSKGNQQRVGLAIALLGDPELLILDEPMSGLDPLGRRLVREIIRELRAKGRTVFFSTHILPDVESLCDDVALIVKGRVVKRGAVVDVLDDRARGWDVRFCAAGEPADEVRRLGLVDRRGRSWQLTLPADADPLAAGARLRELGCELVSIEPHRASLEDQLAAVVERAQEGA